MEIIIKDDNQRTLIKDDSDEAEVNISDGQIIQYTGIYYKTINDISEIAKIETQFIGVIETKRYRYDLGITGIYVKPLYIWDILNYQWRKIVNYKCPMSKYFYYPHLLSLPKTNSFNIPLYFLHTCQNTSLDNFINVTKDFTL